MGEIIIQEATEGSVEGNVVEIVERKGLGHPDTICDLVMEQVSQELSKTYTERFGTILHHNCDKGLLTAGQVENRFGGGKVVYPMRLIIGDRATEKVGNERLDISAIAVDAVKNWFKKHIPRIDPDRHISYQVELRPGSEELTALFTGDQRKIGANDTSAAVGYAPLSETERLVLALDGYIQSKAFKNRFPEPGEDVKIMAVRKSTHLDLTVAFPLIDQFIGSETDYFHRKESIQHALNEYVKKSFRNIDEATLSLNHLDQKGIGRAGMYLSVLGTSAEHGDSGEVGRGNQVNGLISLNRPRGSEAAAGKNPVSHVGKIYNVLAHLLANQIHQTIPGIRNITVWLCSRIGDPVDQPRIISILIMPEKGIHIQDFKNPINDLINAQLNRIPDFCMELAQGRYPIC